MNQLYAIPLGADWTYAGGTGPTGPDGPTGPGFIPYPGSTGATAPAGPFPAQRVITPALYTPNATKLIRAYASYKQTTNNAYDELSGGDQYGYGGLRDNRGLSRTPEAFRLSARTTGISDNSGAWTPLDDGGNLTGLTITGAIQLMIEFRIISPVPMPAFIFSVSVIYENDETDSHFELSVAQSDITNKRFAWWFKNPFNSAVPNLRIQLFNATGPTGPALVDDNTNAPVGTFEISTNGGSSWSTFLKQERANSTTYLRYTPSSLADNIPVRALLTRL